MEFHEFVREFEQILVKQVKRNFPYNWDVSYINLNILKNFKKHFSTLHLENFHEERVNIDFSFYESKSPDQPFFTDIAFIIKTLHRNKDEIEGVTFLETKKRLENSIKFDAIKYPELSRITNAAPHSSLILYDYEKITEFQTVRRNLYYRNYPFYQLTPFTHAAIIPNNIVLTLKRKDTGLYNFSLPFSYQFCLRYLRGFDLDFSKKSMDIARGYVPETKPRFLVFIKIAYGIDIKDKENEFNSNDYIPIKED